MFNEHLLHERTPRPEAVGDKEVSRGCVLPSAQGMSPLGLKAGALPTVPLLPAIIKGWGPEPVYFDQRVNSVSCQTFSKQGHYTWGVE